MTALYMLNTRDSLPHSMYIGKPFKVFFIGDKHKIHFLYFFSVTSQKTYGNNRIAKIKIRTQKVRILGTYV